MNKIEYGNLYKFFVSLGMIFLFSPVIGAFFLINLDAPLISQDQMSALSDYSTKFIERKDSVLDFCFNKFLFFTIPSLILGIFFTAFGLFKWWKNQSKEDAILAATQIKQQFEADQMTVSDIIKKAAEESNESNNTDYFSIHKESNAPTDTLVPDNTNDSKSTLEPIKDTDEKTTPTIVEINTSSAKPTNTHSFNVSFLEQKQTPNKESKNDLSKIVKFFEIEERCFDNLIKENRAFFRRHFISRHVRIGKYTYDAIAVSTESSTDVIFEIKYWPRIPSSALMMTLFDRLKSAGNNYKEYQNRNFEIQLVIVSSNEELNKYNSRIRSCFKILSKKCPVTLILIDEKSLYIN